MRLRTRRSYTLILWLLFPYVLLRLLWRARKQRGYLHHWGERFGIYPRPRPGQPVIWVHAVSVGETRAAAPLIKALQAAYPGHRVLLTHMTPTGRETGESLFGDTVSRCYLPYDYPFAVQGFLAHFRPVLGILMETELWFNLIALCRANHVPLVLANARMSEKSARRYGTSPALTTEALQSLAWVAAQTETDAQRLRNLGAQRNLEVSGNLKFDVEPPEEAAVSAQRLRALFGPSRPVFLAASTREGEEAMILEALKGIAVPGLLCVIVPRHPQRFESVEGLILRHGLRCQRRSTNTPIAEDTQVVLGDTMGEMFSYYGASDVAFIGGSLLPFGGQNLIEAAAMGTPAIIGPHTFNFAEAAELAISCGATVRVGDARELGQQVQAILASAPLRQRMAAAARDFSQTHQGACAKLMGRIETLLPG
jgi:3-deoxy-D-manno-octulosonic-acid transferase